MLTTESRCSRCRQVFSSFWRLSTWVRPCFANCIRDFLTQYANVAINASRFLYAFSPNWTKASDGQLPIYYLRDYTSFIGFGATLFLALPIWLGDALAVSPFLVSSKRLTGPELLLEDIPMSRHMGDGLASHRRPCLTLDREHRYAGCITHS